MIVDVVQLLGISWMDPNWWLDQFGQQFFWLSVGIIFVECGLFFPFLPGDTLLFAMGLFIATDKIQVVPGNKTFDLVVAILILFVGAVLGNISGYEIGRKIGPPIFERNGRILKRKYFDQTREFFEEHGNKALVIGRFVPFVRTYVTVVAGAAEMQRRRFFVWSAVGAAFWITSITALGYFLGKRFDWLGDKIDIAILVILAFTAIPIAYEWFKHRRHQPPAPANPAGSDLEV